MTKLKNEPAAVVSVLVAIVGAAATLGIIGTDQQAQYVAVITAVVPLIGGLIVRAKVTPVAKVADAPSAPVVALPTPAPEPAVTPSAEPAAEPPVADTPPAPAPEDPVKVQLKAAIESVRANSNALNDSRAAAATAAVDASA